MLAGNVPYYVGNSSDEFLHLRLSENADEALVLQDLAFLSDVSTFSILDFLGTKKWTFYNGHVQFSNFYLSSKNTSFVISTPSSAETHHMLEIWSLKMAFGKVHGLEFHTYLRLVNFVYL